MQLNGNIINEIIDVPQSTKEELSFEPNPDFLAPAVQELYSNIGVDNCLQLS